ncbi:hypothetical protein GCM10010140_19440 [Streptosporangium pseudovulgare]|uniref:Transposase DDE domain-containing protein n=1 Tax=Streptosporangium pseudovulgare TaxID=35765 RepID=A0ABQ2QQG1_9ACTN|nr:hypothetical protein GCM10010140_19440 [Streptosporangium pseudovulgare]
MAAPDRGTATEPPDLRGRPWPDDVLRRWRVRRTRAVFPKERRSTVSWTVCQNRIRQSALIGNAFSLGPKLSD